MWRGDEKRATDLSSTGRQRVSYPPVHLRDLTLASITATMDIGLCRSRERLQRAKSPPEGARVAACGSLNRRAGKRATDSGSSTDRTASRRAAKDGLRALDAPCFGRRSRRTMGRAGAPRPPQHDRRERWQWGRSHRIGRSPSRRRRDFVSSRRRDPESRRVKGCLTASPGASSRRCRARHTARGGDVPLDLPEPRAMPASSRSTCPSAIRRRLTEAGSAAL